MVDKVLFSDVENLQTTGQSAASLVNDLKRAVNEVIDTGVGEVLPVLKGGTGADNADDARTNLMAAKDVLATTSTKGLMSAGDKVRVDDAAQRSSNETITGDWDFEGLLTKDTYPVLTQNDSLPTHVPYYFGATAADIPDYRYFYPYPCGCVSEEITATLTNPATEYLLEEWVTNGGFGSQRIPTGVWTFYMYLRKSSASGSPGITARVKVYKLDESLTEELLFTAESDTVTSDTIDLYTFSHTIQTEIPLLLTDRLIVRVYGYRASNPSQNLIMRVAGEDFSSYVDTTLGSSRTTITDVVGLQDALDAKVDIESASNTGTEVEFIEDAFYNITTSGTGNITHDLTGAKRGVEVTIYHNDSSAPTFPAEWVLVGTGSYTISVTNIIIARYISATRIEYVITQ